VVELFEESKLDGTKWNAVIIHNAGVPLYEGATVEFFGEYDQIII